MKTCISCGMPMKEASEFAGGDLSKDYCIYCARPDGSMQSFNEKKAGMIHFIMKTQGFESTRSSSDAPHLTQIFAPWGSSCKSPQ